MLRSVILDFDGVILDTNIAKGMAFVNTFSNQSDKIKKKIFEVHIKNIGLSREKKIKYIVKNIIKKKMSKEEINKLLETFSLIVFENVINSKYILGAKEFIINNFYKYDLHISTATPQNEIIRILEKKKIKDYFLSINGSPKTKNIHIKNIIKEYNYNLNEVLFIGDSDKDYKSALKNKIKFFGILNKFNDFSKIDYKFYDFKEIQKYINDTSIFKNK